MADSALRILIVDDEAPARRRLRDLLDDCSAALPLTVIGEAQHGREALEIMHGAPPTSCLRTFTCPTWTASNSHVTS